MRFREIDEGTVKKWIASQVGKPVHDRFWSVLVDNGCVNDVLVAAGWSQEDFEEACMTLLKRYREYLLVADIGPGATAKGDKERKTVPPDRRLSALAEMIAIEAGRLPDVAAFREEHLGGKLLPFEGVAPWIRERAQGEAGTFDVEFPLPPGIKPPEYVPFETFPLWLRKLADHLEAQNLQVLGSARLKTLRFIDAQTDFVSAVPVDRQGVTGCLKNLAKTLVSRYPIWQEHEAVAFVLTGLVPPIPRASLKVSVSTYMPPTLTLTIDPRMSKVEVANLYSRHRKTIFAGQDKPMSDKHLKLAVFLQEHPEGTWNQRMSVWNDRYPLWEYARYQTFARDAAAAFLRVRGHKFNAQDWELRKQAMHDWVRFFTKERGNSSGEETRS